MEPALPQVAAAIVEAVDELGVEKVCSSNGEVERVLVCGRRDKVDVVGHQAIPQHPDTVLQALLAQEIEISNAVIVDKENVLPVVPALGNVVG